MENPYPLAILTNLRRLYYQRRFAATGTAWRALANRSSKPVRRPGKPRRYERHEVDSWARLLSSLLVVVITAPPAGNHVEASLVLSTPISKQIERRGISTFVSPDLGRAGVRRQAQQHKYVRNLVTFPYCEN